MIKKLVSRGGRTGRRGRGTLSFFNGRHPLRFATIYGYSSSTTVRIGGESEPYYTFGSTPSYGDPYGKRPESSTNDWNAVHYLPSQELVI